MRILILFMFILAFVLESILFVSASVVFEDQGVCVLNPIKDSYVETLNIGSGSPDKNFGSNFLLFGGWAYQFNILMYFDLSECSNHNGFENATFDYTAGWYVSWNDESFNPEVYEVNEDWNEGNVTWNNQPSSNQTSFARLWKPTNCDPPNNINCNSPTIYLNSTKNYYFDEFSSFVKKHWETDKILNFKISGSQANMISILSRESLNPPILTINFPKCGSDIDKDGVCDSVDYCLNSKVGEPVDDWGCDIFQFCSGSGFSCGDSCLTADWKNNEPDVKYPNDCTIAMKYSGGIPQQPVCVPTQFTLGCAN